MGGRSDLFDSLFPRIRALTISVTCLGLFVWEVTRPHPIDWLCVLLLGGAGVPWSVMIDRAIQRAEREQGGKR